MSQYVYALEPARTSSCNSFASIFDLPLLILFLSALSHVCVCVRRLQLLNTTVSSLAITVNNVLTTTYTAVYGGDGIEGADGEELNLLVSPLTSISELQGLYTSNLVDFETAIPAALHSLGCTAEEISAALERRRAQEKETADMKKIEEKTAKAELERREKDAINPPKPETAGGAKKPAKSAASAPAPAPASPGASSKSDE